MNLNEWEKIVSLSYQATVSLAIMMVFLLLGSRLMSGLSDVTVTSSEKLSFFCRATCISKSEVKISWNACSWQVYLPLGPCLLPCRT